MKVKNSFLVISATVALFALSPISQTEPLAKKDTEFIVELKDVYGTNKEDRVKAKNEFIHQLRNTIGFNFDVTKSLDAISNMLVLQINNEDINAIKNMQYVSYASKSLTYQPCETSNSFNADQTDVAPFENFSRVDMKVPETNGAGKGTLIAVLDNSFQVDHDSLQALDAGDVRYTESQIDTLTGVSGFSGASGNYYNTKVPYYYDYADKDKDVLNPKEYHGVHVTSIAAGNGIYTGIAPKAQVALMKVFSNSSSGASDSTIITALNDAYLLGVDVVNMSLGSANEDDPDEKTSASYLIIEKLEELGVTCSISAGNDGKANFIKDSNQTNDFGDYDKWSLDNVETGILGSYANYDKPMIVASSVLADDSKSAKSSYYNQKVSAFSSDGATFDLGLNPDIIAPGTNIWGAIYNTDSSKIQYGYLSGTSMAAPNYAGAVANILSSSTFATKEERTAFKKTIAMRTMSTAHPYEQYVGGFYTPRKQGAGLVDIGSSISSDVYLESADLKAKVELKNNGDIAKGDIKFDVKTHNESAVSKSYNAKLYVETPALVSENSYQSLFDSLNETVDLGTINIASGEGTFNVNHSITDATKAALANFPNGTYLEGYVILDSVESSDPDLSIPYMGFYGDYSTAEAVEKFDFEKDSTKKYGSDVVNSFYQKFYSNQSVDFASAWVVSANTINDVAVNKIRSNGASIYDYGTNVTRQTDGSLVVGITGKSNYMAIQQLVYRSVVDNTVTMTNDSTGEVVYTGKLSDISQTKATDTSGRLYKSCMTSETVGNSNVYDCHRAFLSMPIINASTGKLIYPEGTYTFKFSYELAAGSTFNKTYKLIVKEGVAVAPSINKKEIIDKDGVKYVRAHISGDDITSVTASGDEMTLVEDGDDKYVDIPYADYEKKGRILLVVTNLIELSTTELFNLDDMATSGYGVLDDELKTTYSTSLTITEGEVADGYFTNVYTSVVTDARGKELKLGSHQIIFNIAENASALVSDISIKEVGYDSTLSDAVFSVIDESALLVSTTTGVLNVTYKYIAPEVDTPKTDSKLGLIIGLSIGGVVLVAGIIVVIILIKKKGMKNAK